MKGKGINLFQSPSDEDAYSLEHHGSDCFPMQIVEDVRTPIRYSCLYVGPRTTGILPTLIADSLRTGRESYGEVQGDSIVVRCPKTQEVHELEFLGWEASNPRKGEYEGWWYFITTDTIGNGKQHKYLRIDPEHGGGAAFRTRAKIAEVLASQSFYIST